MSHHAATELGETYTAAVLSSSAEIHQLDGTVHRLMPERDIALEPRFFLALISNEWMPRVVVVKRGEDTVGVVYAKERRIAGIRTGVLYVDGRLNNMVVADEADRDEVIRVAIQSLFALPRVRGLRLAIPPVGLEARAVARTQTLAPYDVAYSSEQIRPHARLRLTTDYQRFVQSLGYKTRRNLRHYCRKFDAAGHTYAKNLSRDDVHRAMGDLAGKSRIRSRSSEIKRALNVVAAADRPFAVGLKHRNGGWLSVSGGWYSADRAMMFFQLNNDREYGDTSLSLVLRAKLIETLIEEQVPELMFWSGCMPPLSRYAVDVPAIMVHLDTPTAGWRFIRSVIRVAQPHLSRWMSTDLRGIVSSGPLPPPPRQSFTRSGEHGIPGLTAARRQERSPDGTR